MTLLNEVTTHLRPYPMEELTRIRQGLIKAGHPVFDFGTGDPKIPTWEPIRDAMLEAVPKISQYPSVKGSEALNQAQLGYLKRRFQIENKSDLATIPTAGSKEAVFNIGLCLIGRGGKKFLIYPDPGYPVYRSSALYSGGIPYPVRITEADKYLLKPWTLPKDVQENAAAIWINYPHNPTGAMAPKEYFEEVIDWCHRTDTILLSDDCYVDIYNPELEFNNSTKLELDKRPLNPLQISTDRVLSFMSLSKRSGITGYRSGMLAGDSRLIGGILRARANFGVGSPDFVQASALVAWNDDAHVAERRKIFTHRMNLVGPIIQEMGLIDYIPQATFYLWCRLPEAFKRKNGDNDIKFVMDLAELGVITSPSQWLSEGIKGYFRFALVPDDKSTLEAIAILKKFVGNL